MYLYVSADVCYMNKKKIQMLLHDMMLNMLYARETTEHRTLDWSQKEGQQSAAIRVIQQLYFNPKD